MATWAFFVLEILAMALNIPRRVLDIIQEKGLSNVVAIEQIALLSVLACFDLISAMCAAVVTYASWILVNIVLNKRHFGID